MHDEFDIINLYSHYLKKTICENKKVITENEIEIDFNSPHNKQLSSADTSKILSNKSKKLKTTLYVYDDVPTSFQINYEYNILFDAKKIFEDFNTTDVDTDDDYGNSNRNNDDDIDSDIYKKLNKKNDKNTVNKNVKRRADMPAFYYTVFTKNFPVYAMKNKIIKSNLSILSEYELFSVTYSTQVDDKLLLKKVESAVKSNKSVPITYGYEISFKCKNNKSVKSVSEVVDVVLDFSKKFETEILADTEYFKILPK